MSDVGNGEPTRRATREERSEPLFSVIIPAYNAEAVLAKSLASVRRQTLDDFEVVVVDDGSADDTASVVESYTNELAMTCIRQSNSGAATARNIGAAAARGRYVVFLDADDEAHPEWLERVASSLAAQRAPVICCGYELGEGSFTGIVRSPVDLGPAFYGYKGLFIPGTYAVERRIFEAVGGFVNGLPYGEHSELALRITRYCHDSGHEILAIDEPLIIKHHDRSPGVVASYDRARLVGATYQINAHAEQLSRDPSHLADYHAVAGVASARLSEYRDARVHLWKALRLRRRLRDLGRFLLSLLPPVADRFWFRHS